MRNPVKCAISRQSVPCQSCLKIISHPDFYVKDYLIVSYICGLHRRKGLNVQGGFFTGYRWQNPYYKMIKKGWKSVSRNWLIRLSLCESAAFVTLYVFHCFLHGHHAYPRHHILPIDQFITKLLSALRPISVHQDSLHCSMLLRLFQD